MSKPLIAGLMPVGPNYNAQFLHHALNNLRNLCDRLIVLEDKCDIPDRVICDEVVHVHNVEPFQDYGNRLTLLSRAAAHGTPWCIFLDADEAFEPRLTKGSLIEIIREADSVGAELIECQLCEMFDSEHYRTDGIWGQKRKVRIQRNPLLKEAVHWRGNHMQPLHAVPMQCGDVFHTDIRILHWGMASPELREARVKKHEALDFERKYQDDYRYMLDETGIELKKL